MAGRLAGKVALITGGTTGIGNAAARIFKAEGARVAITGQNAERVAAAAEALGPDVLALRSDAGRIEDIDALEREVAARLGPLDILFLNAGDATYGTLSSATEDEFDRLFAVNVKGVFFAVQRFAPSMRRGGSIVVTTSMNNRIGMPNTHLYAASKAASRQLCRTLAKELAPAGIRVNAVAPGPTITEIGPKTGLDEAGLAKVGEYVLPRVPLGRFAAAEELARAALFLASDDSSFITGEEIVADGGWTGVNA